MVAAPTPLKSFIPVPAESPFPIQNLPLGVFRRQGDKAAKIGVAIGDYVLDLDLIEGAGLLESGRERGFFNRGQLNELATEGQKLWRPIRQRLQTLLSADCPTLRDHGKLRELALIPQSQVTMGLPFRSSGYTDFYSSIHHASNVGKLFRDKENPLLPNWRHIPVAYNGRASSLLPTATEIRRPWGQISPGPGQAPMFSPSQKLDFELELGYYIGLENHWGESIPVANAHEHIFGLVLVNDWSARDHQAWEYVPLGPFLSKSFATSVSPWVVSPDALKPFLRPMEPQDPRPLPYLHDPNRRMYDLTLEVWLKPAGESSATKICTTNTSELYWSLNQQVAHHTVNGCNLQTGDLLATGTISGKAKNSLGSLLEATLNGTEPLVLASGATRRFLEDNDEVTMVAYAEGVGLRIGLGEVTGKILPAKA